MRFQRAVCGALSHLLFPGGAVIVALAIALVCLAGTARERKLTSVSGGGSAAPSVPASRSIEGTPELKPLPLPGAGSPSKLVQIPAVPSAGIKSICAVETQDGAVRWILGPLYHRPPPNLL